MLVAAGLALGRFGRHPRVSLITLAGVVIYFFRLLFLPVVFYFVPDMGRALHLAPSQAEWCYTAINILDDAFLALVAIFFVVAALTGRQQVAGNQIYQGTN
jgi:hypothetical protein